jgi:DNA repair exonuclease SbcCD ATPase subunit
MNAILKQRVSTLKGVSQENDYALSLTKEKIELQSKYISDLSHSKQEKIQENLALIEKNKDQAKTISDDIESQKNTIVGLRDQLNFKSELMSQIDKIKDIKTKLDSNIKKTRREITFYEENDNCPTCHQNIPGDFKLVEIGKKNSKISEWQNGITDAESAMVRFLTKMEEAKAIEDQIDSIQSQIVKNQSMIDGINQFIKKIAKDTLDLKNQQDAPQECNERLLELNTEQEQLERNKIAFSNQKNIQDLATALLKDGGVKARIIKQYLPLINKHTNIFLNAMNFFVTFNIDEEFNECIKSRGRDDFAYENFSEGEKQRIDLALLFTWRTIAKMKNSVNTNLLIMDEVLDSYLDQTATENVLQLLNSDMFKDTNVFVISHKETISDKFQKTIRFTKNKNFSNIV